MEQILKQKQLKVLYLEEEGFIKEILRNMINKYGYYVKGVKTCLEMLQEFKKYYKNNNIYDIIMFNLDIIYEVGGLDIIKRIKSISPHTKGILYSSSFIYPPMEFIKSLGYDNFIQKPFSLNELNRIIENTI